MEKMNLFENEDNSIQEYAEEILDKAKNECKKNCLDNPNINLIKKDEFWDNCSNRSIRNKNIRPHFKSTIGEEEIICLSYSNLEEFKDLCRVLDSLGFTRYGEFPLIDFKAFKFRKDDALILDLDNDAVLFASDLPKVVNEDIKIVINERNFEEDLSLLRDINMRVRGFFTKTEEGFKPLLDIQKIEPGRMKMWTEPEKLEEYKIIAEFYTSIRNLDKLKQDKLDITDSLNIMKHASYDYMIALEKEINEDLKEMNENISTPSNCGLVSGGFLCVEHYGDRHHIRINNIIHYLKNAVNELLNLTRGLYNGNEVEIYHKYDKLVLIYLNQLYEIKEELENILTNHVGFVNEMLKDDYNHLVFFTEDIVEDINSINETDIIRNMMDE